MTMRFHRSRKGQRGVAAVELGLLALPLAVLTFGSAEFGRAVHQYDTLTKSVRDATRHQTTMTPGNHLAGRCLALTGQLGNDGTGCSGTPLLPGLLLAHVTVCDRANCADHNLQQTSVAGSLGGTVNLVSVTISGYSFTSMTPFTVPTFTYQPVRATMVQPL